MNGLKPCPRCGGDARFVIRHPLDGQYVAVECKKCGMALLPFLFHRQNVNFRLAGLNDVPCQRAIRRARAKWNRRREYVHRDR